MTFQGKGILVGTRNRVRHGNVIGFVAHRAILERAPETVVEHRVDRLPIAKFPALAHARQQIGSTAHALHAAGDDHLGIFGADRLIGQHHGLQSRTANFVHAHRRHRRRQFSREGRLPGRGLTDTGRQDVTQNHIVDLVDVDAGAAQHFGDDRRRQFRSGEVRQSPLEFSDRRAAPHQEIGTAHKSASRLRPEAGDAEGPGLDPEP